MIKFFEKYPEIIAVMSERKDGSMKLFTNGNLDGNNEENRKKYFKKIEIDNEKVIFPYLQSGTNIKIIENNNLKIIPKTDALITKNKNLYLSITAADCVPVMFYDTKAKIIGLAHAGWRGTVEGVVLKTIDEIIKLGGKVENITVVMGPGINKCHFEVKKDVLNKFNNYPEFVEKIEDRYFVDLKGIIKKQLFSIGVREKSIENNNDCTFCNKDKYYSYRREKSKNFKATLALIGQH